MSNPFCFLTTRGEPLLELKMGLVLYLRRPPGPVLARKLYHIYMALAGSRIRYFCSTAPGSLPKPWTTAARYHFEGHSLPRLRQYRDWGYGFADGLDIDSWLFMFHGSRPASEVGKASFFRFDFPWGFDPLELRALATEVLEHAEVLSGFAGPYFQINVGAENASCDRMYAVARRYWGIEAHNLDVTLWYTLAGIKCVNWITVVGRGFIDAAPEVIELAKVTAYWWHETKNGILLQAEEAPRYIDRNRGEPLDGYKAMADVLEPLQVDQHGSFGGTKWDETNTISYLRRFTDGTV